MKQTVTKKLSERDTKRGEGYKTLETRTVHTLYLEVKCGSEKETLQKNLLHLKLWSGEVTRDKGVRKCPQRVHNASTLDLLLSVYFTARSFSRKTMYLSTFDITHTIISLRILATYIQSIIIDVMETATRLSCSICIVTFIIKLFLHLQLVPYRGHILYQLQREVTENVAMYISMTSVLLLSDFNKNQYVYKIFIKNPKREILQEIRRVGIFTITAMIHYISTSFF